VKQVVWLIVGLSWLGWCNGWAIAQPDPKIPAVPPAVVDRPLSSEATIAPAEAVPATDPMAQMRSVDELSDVRPGDWAYEALRSLIERYRLNLGYPDGKFRGNRPMTRFEFAAAMREVLDAINLRLRTDPIISQLREDFPAIRRLQETYGRIAADLQTSFNQLEAQVDQLETQQFSTTTKLSGEVIGGLTDGTDAEATLIDRVRLELRTSFSGQDLLVTQLEAGNNGLDAVNRAQEQGRDLLGTRGELAGGGGLDYVGAEAQPRIRSLYYSFQPARTVNITVGAKLAPGDFIDFNRFASSALDSFASNFFTHNPLIVQNSIQRSSGAGAVVTWRPENSSFAARALYVAADAEFPSSDRSTGGFFRDRNQASVELEYAFSKAAILRLQYTHANINGTTINAAGINAEWVIGSQFGVFGRYGFGSYKGYNSVLDQNLDLNPQSWQLGFVVRRVVIPGSTAGLAIGQPFIDNDLGNATQTNIEAFYRFLLNDKIAFSPALIVVTNPDNQRTSAIWQWVVQMMFTF
jgi:hypothetical protein